MSTTAAAAKPAAAVAGARVVPPEPLLLEFLKKATQDLEKWTILDRVHSRSEIRSLLLQRQVDVLNHVVEEFNNNNNNNDNTDEKLTSDDVQNALKTAVLAAAETATAGGEESSAVVVGAVQQASQQLNEAARLAYCRLVLYSGCFQERQQQYQQYSSQHPQQELKESGEMSRDDILELCGLCTTVLRLPLVQQHLEEPGRGTPLFHALLLQQHVLRDGGDDDNNDNGVGGFTSIFPHERLEHIQRIFLQMLGYNADHGTAEIKRIFYNANNTDNEYTQDEQVMPVFHEMMSQIQSTLATATRKISQINLFSDQEQGGSTRIVAVHYSEHEIDARTGQVILATTNNSGDHGSASSDTLLAAAAPKGQAMEDNTDAAAADSAAASMRRHQEEQQQQLRTAAVAAAKLQQEILAQILSLPEAERQDELLRAKLVAERVVQQVLELAPGPDRVAFLQSQDTDTQRLLALHKLWETHVTSKNSNNTKNDNGTGPAKIRYAPGFAPE